MAELKKMPKLERIVRPRRVLGVEGRDMFNRQLTFIDPHPKSTRSPHIGRCGA